MNLGATRADSERNPELYRAHLAAISRRWEFAGWFVVGVGAGVALGTMLTWLICRTP